MTILPIDPREPEPVAIVAAADVLRSGGVVAFPTDTLYGLAVDPTRDAPVARLFAIKGRTATAAIPLIASDLEQAGRAGRFGPVDLRLASRFWPGPLTLVISAQPGLSRVLLGGGSTVAVRVPDHAVARALAEAHGHPITATSANLSGDPPAAAPDAISRALASRIDLLLDAGPAPGGPPSTIVEAGTRGVRLVRAGAVAWERVLESLE